MPFPDARAALAALADGSASPEALREIVTAFPQLRSVVAAYPAADEPLLAWLRDLRDPAVDAQLAKRTAATPPPGPVVQPTPVQPVPQPTAVHPVRQAAPVHTAPQPVVAVPAAAKPPATPTEPPAAPSEPRPRRMWPVVVGVLAALVVLGGGVGLAFAGGLLGGSTGTQAAPPPAEPTEQPSETASAQPTESPGVSEPPSQSPNVMPTPTPTTMPVGLTCWDGSAGASAADCAAPTGKDAAWEYLRFAFPSIASHATCEQVDSSKNREYSGFTVMWDCELGEALVRYRFWEKPSDAVSLYDDKYDAKTTLATYDLLVGADPVSGWVKTDKDTVKGPGGVKRVVATGWLPDHQLSFSVEGDTTDALWAAFETIRMRPADQLLGQPADQTPVEVPVLVQPA
ncbi:hypothetical protein [Micropruina sp.]|uniref:variant leucine-rich repeat-containing protein n=1 Tax=Micropruina sp. TaxID=2737536 RepID=UPI0026256CCC|nr:hypothetical protein [Micropruina sp.]